MYHYDPNTALEELTEDATLPNPVHGRDMILRMHPSTDKALELNRMFVEYQKFFGEAQKLGKEILKRLAGEAPRSELFFLHAARRLESVPFQNRLFRASLGGQPMAAVPIESASHHL